MKAPLGQRINTARALREPDAVKAFINGPYGGGNADRPHLVVGWAQRLSDEDGPAFWEVILSEWSGFDAIPHDDFEILFAKFPPPPCDVPEFLTVYRGQNAGSPSGLSWTLDCKVARSFANGHRNIRNPNPVVLELKVTREQVAFVCDDRDEAEVVLRAVPDRFLRVTTLNV